MATVADVVKRIERIKKDLEYVRTFQDKWRDQRDRFPKIYEGILEQERAFLRRIEELRGLRVDSNSGDLLGVEDAPPVPAVDDEQAPASKPRVEHGPGGESGRPDSSDEKRAAAAEIGEKLRKRSAAASEAETAGAK